MTNKYIHMYVTSDSLLKKKKLMVEKYKGWRTTD